MIVVALIFELLAAAITLGNIVGCISATKDRGYSCVPLFSLLFLRNRLPAGPNQFDFALTSN